MEEKINTDRIRLKDILRAITDIEYFSHEPTPANRMQLYAMAYGIAIIGEAYNYLSPALKDAHPEIPWR